MATYTRRNAWNLGGDFNNKDLYWYAIGVRAMMNRSLNDHASWWFFAAIHGEYVSPSNNQPAFPGWAHIPGPPKVPTSPLPSRTVMATYWNQCQHQSWFFAPWHRGYLVAIEAQLREDIVQAKGPADWSLPYWDYFGSPGDQFDIPPAFTQQTLPDGSPNSLFVTARYGPYGNKVVFDPTAAGRKKYPPPKGFTGIVTDSCLANTVYTGFDANTTAPGFGGPLTGFWHGDFYRSGNLEQDPHNGTHVHVGGPGPGINGLMTDPGIAALDPIFYLHHANIDRMWAVWNLDPAHTNPSDTNWLNGPGASGEPEFIMPMPGKKSWTYVPKDVNSLNQMNYTYDYLKQVPAVNLQAQRLSRLGISALASPIAAEASRKTVELVGANDDGLSITGAGVSTTVQLDPEVQQKVMKSLATAAMTSAPDRVYLDLENVRGTNDATSLSIYINLPQGSDANDHPELLAGTVALFGLRRASRADGKHLGGGLSFLLDISPIVDQMQAAQTLNTDNVRVTIVPFPPASGADPVTVGRVSIYREGS